jgi:hypothetical protein
VNHIRRLRPVRRVAGALAILAGALLASAAMTQAAFALPAPPKGGAGGTAPLPPAHTVTVGMPGWQIALIAAAAAVAAAAMAVILDRARATRRHQAAPSA